MCAFDGVRARERERRDARARHGLPCVVPYYAPRPRVFARGAARAARARTQGAAGGAGAAGWARRDGAHSKRARMGVSCGS